MPQSRPRNTVRQREAGAAARLETKRRLLAAAAEEFAAHGYAGATVNQIAGRAGVTVQTLYLAWGSKRELLRAYLEAALSGQPVVPAAAELPRLITAELADAGAGAGADLVIARMVRLYCQIAQRAALAWQLYREAAASDPAIAEDWVALQHLRHQTFTHVIAQLPSASLRTGLSPEAAADTAWAVASPETYDLLVRIRGYTLIRYEQWLVDTLSAAILAT
jgi:AcrR family transcriptional regulator